MNRWLVLFVAVQALNATAVIAAIRGIPLAVSDERFQNSVMYAALVLNTVLLLIGLRIAGRLRPRFARPS
ncbi:MAG TPA: hypothetical protein VFY04_05055 [Solirubrobacterales bacterium]|nr:hypothetical protein [Solirubrobacterales bacterium]